MTEKAATSQHTPGPWRQSEKAKDAIIADQGIEGDQPADEFYGGVVIAESIAPHNRPAIIALPDLLAAAESARECLGEILEDTYNDAGERVANPLLLKLDTAIAKARGQS